MKGDLTITCARCGDSFVHPADKHELYKRRGLAMPKQCHRCRELRKDHIHGNTAAREALTAIRRILAQREAAGREARIRAILEKVERGS